MRKNGKVKKAMKGSFTFPFGVSVVEKEAA